MQENPTGFDFSIFQGMERKILGDRGNILGDCWWGQIGMVGSDRKALLTPKG